MALKGGGGLLLSRSGALVPVDLNMELRYAFLTATLVLSRLASAQGLVNIRDEEGNLVNGTVIYHESQPSNSTDTVSLLTSLVGSSTTTVNVRRYEVWPVAGTKNFYCWGVCFLPANVGTNPIWVSVENLTLNPGLEYDNFHAYYKPQGQAGTMRFRFVWYDVANEFGADSSWVDIDFGQPGGVGLNEVPSGEVAFTTSPNPAIGQDIQVNYSMDRAGMQQLVVYTMLGERVRRMNLPTTQGRVILPTADLVPGVYFANIERNGQVLSTRRLIVAR